MYSEWQIYGADYKLCKADYHFFLQYSTYWDWSLQSMNNYTFIIRNIFIFKHEKQHCQQSTNMYFKKMAHPSTIFSNDRGEKVIS